jgi:hypothetical protein
LFAVLATACGDDGTAPSEEQLAGTWKATKAEFVSKANSSQKVEIVALGATVTVTLTEGGAFTLVVSIPGSPVETNTGTWSASGEVLTLHFATGFIGQWEFDMSLSGNTLTLSGADAEFDVNGDDQDDEVKLNLVLARQ